FLLSVLPPRRRFTMKHLLAVLSAVRPLEQSYAEFLLAELVCWFKGSWSKDGRFTRKASRFTGVISGVCGRTTDDSSICFANPAMVGFSKNVRNVSSRLKFVLIRETTWVASNE